MQVQPYVFFNGRCDEAIEFYQGALDAQVQMPLAKTFFSPAFGMLADRFGVSWMVYVGK